jgi:tetratricopeptide (TPR) repeat protein
MSARSLLSCALASLLACSCSVPRPRAPARPPQASDFEAAIARTERTDPGSPAVLSVKLAYAQFLLGQDTPPCAQRVNLAQEQIGSVAVNPEAQVMFPGGWALVADLEYRQHLARAACGSQANRRDELLAAVEAARRAAELYRKEFDYRSMVIMQFDAAVALRRLGENAAALAALEKALDMDREYGFQEDARENYKLLLRWRGEPAGAAQVARLMQDFPKRRATFKFGWHTSDAQVRLERHRESLEDGRIVSSRAGAAFERRIAATPAGGWSVSYAHRLARYEPGVWPSEPGLRAQQLAFPAALLPAVGFKVSATGEFQGTTDSDTFATRLSAKAEKLIRAGAPSGRDAAGLVSEAVETATDTLSPGMLEADAAEDYQLETAMWIGATLEQGVWYETSAPLSLPGMPHLIVQSRIEFAFTRKVPCTAEAAVENCVEIVIHATPEQQALTHLLDDLGGAPPDNMFVDYFASSETRLVTDPATLLPYARDERVYWFTSIGKDKGDTVLQSEHLVSTMRYSAQEDSR